MLPSLISAPSTTPLPHTGRCIFDFAKLKIQTHYISLVGFYQEVGKVILQKIYSQKTTEFHGGIVKSYIYLQSNKALKQNSRSSSTAFSYIYLQNNKALKRYTSRVSSQAGYIYLQNNKALKLFHSEL